MVGSFINQTKRRFDVLYKDNFPSTHLTQWKWILTAAYQVACRFLSRFHATTPTCIVKGLAWGYSEAAIGEACGIHTIHPWSGTDRDVIDRSSWIYGETRILTPCFDFSRHDRHSAAQNGHTRNGTDRDIQAQYGHTQTQ